MASEFTDFLKDAGREVTKNSSLPPAFFCPDRATSASLVWLHPTRAPMEDMRFNPISLDWVIMAPDRGSRPNDFRHGEVATRVRPPFRPDCPFCPGNESATEEELFRVPGPDGSWAVRVVPNKYPAFRATDDLRRETRGTFRSMAASGSHEVVVEHPRHDVTLRDAGASHLAAILYAYRARYHALERLPHAESIIIFKNHGERAGTSLEHPHSQIIASPVVSPQVFARLGAAREFHKLRGICLYCQVMEDELEAGTRIVESHPSFIAFAPFASLSPYHTWIFPRAHQPSFGSVSDEEILALAGVIRRHLLRLATAAGEPDYNITIRTAPVREATSCCFHWYLAVVPRIGHLAGFELGSGTFINSMRPEICAERLRSVPILD